MAGFDDARSSWNRPESIESWRYDPTSEPPAYGSLGDFDSHREYGGDATTCCAFEKLYAATKSSNRQNQLHQSPQLRLVSWVMICRIFDDSLPLSERFSCPMENCTEVFNPSQNMQLVNHVSGCPHLSGGVYRCPYHGHEHYERFMQPTHPQQTRKSSKRGFFRHTIGKICGLGSRSLRMLPSHSQHSQRSFICHSVERQTSSMKRPYPDDTAMDAPELVHGNLAELDGFAAVHADASDKFFVSAEPSGPFLQTRAELPTNVADTFPEMDVPQQFPERSELSEKRMSTTSVQSTSVGSLSPAEQSPISPLTPQSIFSTDGFDRPMSPTQMEVYSHKRARYVAGPAWPTNNPNPTSLSNLANSSSSSVASDPSKRKTNRQVPQIRVDTSFNTAPTAEDVSPFSVSSESAASETLTLPPDAPHPIDNDDYNSRQLVQELRGVFNCLFKLSMCKLCKPTVTPAGLNLLSLRPSATLLFTNGLQALQKVVRGEVPQDFLEIFGLSILPYACGIAGEDANLQDQFGSIFQDQIGWSQAIVDPHLRDIYVDLVWELWATSDFQRSRDQSDLQQAIHNNLEGLNQPWTVELEADFPELDFGLDTDTLSAAMDDSLSFFASPFSIDHTAVKLCLKFLDAFEFLQVDLKDPGNSPQDTPSFGYNVSPGPAYSSVIMDHIMHPLTSNPPLGPFRGVIDITCFLIAETNNVSLRNTELSLLEAGKKQGSERLLYDAFADEVRHLSDNAATILGCTGYRLVYYNNDVAKLVEIHDELMTIERYHRDHRRRRGSRSASSSPRSGGKGKGSANVSPTSSGYSESPSSSTAPYQNQPFTLSSTSSSPIEAGIFHSRNNSNEDVLAGVRPDVGFAPYFTHSSSMQSSSVQSSSVQSSAVQSFSSPSPRPGAPRRDWQHMSNRPMAVAAAGSSTSTPGMPGSGGHTPPPPRPDEKVKRQCPHCNQVFEQQAQYIRANITRHIREKHRENAKKLGCMEPGCSYTSTRKGNLTHHQRAVHGVVH